RSETYARSVWAEARSTRARWAAKASISGFMPGILPASGNVRQKHAGPSGGDDGVDDMLACIVREARGRIDLLRQRLEPVHRRPGAARRAARPGRCPTARA